MKGKIFFTILSLSIFFSATGQHTASPNVSQFEIEAPQLDTLKRIWIYLPKTYNNSDKRYPVIYMHDAQNLFDKKTSYVGEWQIDESLDSLKTPEAIIIGIEHGGDKRIEELTPFANEKYGGGKADAYLDFIVNNLKPYIDNNYRSLPDYQNTGIFGSSLGGLVSYYAALKYSQTFGMVGVFSPSFWFNEKIYDLTEKTELNPETKFYFLVGTAESEEMVPDLERMIEVLKKAGLKNEKFQVNYVEGGEHNESLWKENFPRAYIWLMNP